MKLRYLALILFILSFTMVGCDKIDSIFEDKSGFSEECLEFADEMIPEYVKYYDPVRNSDKLYIEDNARFGQSTSVVWNDGLESDIVVWYRQGNEQGENINYLYPDLHWRDALPSQPYWTIYEKQIVSEDGTIKGKNQFYVRFILDNENREAFEVDAIGNFNKQGFNFPIVDYELNKCEFIE